MVNILQGQLALITGGTAGIGKAVAAKFAAEGARVVLFGSNSERGERAIQELQKAFPKSSIRFMQVDVSQSASVKPAIQHLLSENGSVDILVNNAGITKDQLLLKMTEEDWDSVIETNLNSCYRMTQPLVRNMIKAKKGRIINISSVVGMVGNAGQTNYAASKAAIIGFTKALARELASAHRPITVNCIAPGYIATAMTASLTDGQKEALLNKIPLGRFGLPEEVANAALFLASDQANYITGQVLAIDGGMTMGG